MPYIEIVQKYAQKNRFEYNHEEIFNKVRGAMEKSGAEREKALMDVLKTTFRAEAERYEPTRKKLIMDMYNMSGNDAYNADMALRNMARPAKFLEEYTEIIGAMAKDIDNTYAPEFMLGMTSREAKNLVSDQLNIFTRFEETMYTLKRDGWNEALNIVNQVKFSKENNRIRNYATADEEHQAGMMDVYMRKEGVKKELSSKNFFWRLFSSEGRAMRNYVKVAEDALKAVNFPEEAAKSAEVEYAQASAIETAYEESYREIDNRFESANIAKESDKQKVDLEHLSEKANAKAQDISSKVKESSSLSIDNIKK